MRLIRFDAHGWRARVGAGFDEPSVIRIASALGTIWQTCPEHSCVLVGYDTRRDSARLAQVLGEVIASYGLHVVVSSTTCTTPALGWSVATDPHCVAGVMLTASEAPCTYGGIIVRQPDGGSLTNELADYIEKRIAADVHDRRAAVERRDLMGAYEVALLAACDTDAIGSRRPRVVVDPLYGACCESAVRMLEAAGCEVIPLHDMPVADFRGLHPDPCEPWVDECERAVVRAQADLGVVFDGDGDRAALVDASGRLVNAHLAATLVLEEIVERHGGGRVVSSSASSVRIERQALRLGCEHTMVPVGSEAIYRELGEGDVCFATDEYGGICMPAHLKNRDGMLLPLMACELMARSGSSLRALVKGADAALGHMEYGTRDIRMDPAALQRICNLLPGLNPSEVAGDKPVDVRHADGLRVRMSDESWLLVRPSRTRSMIRVRAEAPTAARLAALLAEAPSLIGVAS